MPTVLLGWWEVLTVSCGQPGCSAPDTPTDRPPARERGRWRNLRGPRRPQPRGHPALTTRDRGQPSHRTNSRGFDMSSQPTDTWQRRGGRISVLSSDSVRTSSRSGSRTREPSWRSRLERRESWPRCWRLRDCTITTQCPLMKRTLSSELKNCPPPVSTTRSPLGCDYIVIMFISIFLYVRINIISEFASNFLVSLPALSIKYVCMSPALRREMVQWGLAALWPTAHKLSWKREESVRAYIQARSKRER